jgi:cathepsin C
MPAYLLGFVVLIAAPAWADLPVHCLHEDVRGTWTFHLGAANLDKNQISQEPHMCSKGVTTAYGSKTNNYGLSSEPNFLVQKQIKVELAHPNIARTTANGQTHEGTWTMIYDEGFEVNLMGAKFFAFSKYSSDNEKEFSHCDKTFPGWFHPATNPDSAKWGCYYGEKDTPVTSKPYKKFGDRVISPNDVFVREDELVQEVNSRAESHWTAKHYEEFEGRPMAELQMQSGTVLRPYKLRPEELAEQQSWAQDSLVDISDIPAQWDWRNVGGKNFVGPVRNQGSCGSCYSVAVSEMVSSRMRILANDPSKPRLSPDRVLKCAMYAQGCHGGFPYLASKYLQDFGSVTEEAQPYTARDGECPKDVPVVSRNFDYKYVGGYYGASGEKAMLRDVFDHGPLVVGFEVGMGFRSYQGGIFHTLDHLPEKNHWLRVNHAVLIVGYGVENGVKFWTVKNSWGPSWGEAGYFRIRRGDDNLNIEHMSVAAYPTVGSNLPPKDGEKAMDPHESQGHAFMAMLEQHQGDVSSPMSAHEVAPAAHEATIDDPALHATASDKIEDPAFTGHDVAPVMEEVQVDETVPEDDGIEGIVEETEAEEWPEA